MKNIKVVDMHDAKTVSDQEMESVKGGPAYIKFDGVDGESRDSDHKKWIDILSFSSPTHR